MKVLAHEYLLANSVARSGAREYTAVNSNLLPNVAAAFKKLSTILRYSIISVFYKAIIVVKFSDISGIYDGKLQD